MNVLLVDNGALHIEYLQYIFTGHNVKTIVREDLPSSDFSQVDLIVLSGSSDTSVVVHPNEYIAEIALIKSTNIPIIGICMGFEVIAYTYGANFKEYKDREKGFIQIEVTQEESIFNKQKSFNVYESHKWSVTKVKKPLIELARSKDGIEIIKHQTRKIYGFQFHPEYVDDANTGAVILENLLKIIFD